MDDTAALSPIPRTHLVQQLALGLRFGRTRSHHGDDLMAHLAFEKLAEYLVEAKLVVAQTEEPDAERHPGRCRGQ